MVVEVPDWDVKEGCTKILDEAIADGFVDIKTTVQDKYVKKTK